VGQRSTESRLRNEAAQAFSAADVLIENSNIDNPRVLDVEGGDEKCLMGLPPGMTARQKAEI